VADNIPDCDSLFFSVPSQVWRLRPVSFIYTPGALQLQAAFLLSLLCVCGLNWLDTSLAVCILGRPWAQPCLPLFLNYSSVYGVQPINLYLAEFTLEKAPIFF